MAECCVCNKKIGFFGGFILQTKFNKYMVCNVCSDMIWNGLKKNDINTYIALRKFYPTMNADVKEYIDDKWASAGRSTENIEAEIAAHEKAEREERENATRLSEIKSSMLLTTGYNFECYNISEYVGVISGESVLGTGFLSELSASSSDFFGVQSLSFSKKLKLAKDIATDQLKDECIKKGGNAIIGVDFDYLTFRNNMIGVIANGTAVIIEKSE